MKGDWGYLSCIWIVHLLNRNLVLWNSDSGSTSKLIASMAID